MNWKDISKKLANEIEKEHNIAMRISAPSYVKEKVSGNKMTLELTKEGKKELEEMIEDKGSEYIDTDEAEGEFFEHFIANSSWEWINPEEVGDLTDAPMLGIKDKNDNVIERYAFMNYQVESLLGTLLEKGKVVLEGGKIKQAADENPLEDAGVADKKDVTVKDVDPDQFEKGVKVEMEHTDDPESAAEITLDHLGETDNPKGSRYYTWLEFAEKMNEKTEGMETSQLEDKIKKLEEYWNTL